MKKAWAVAFRPLLLALIVVILVSLDLTGFALCQDKPTEPVLRTASRHPMQYYVSLPEGWTPDKKWTIVVTVTGGLKDFQTNAKLFAAARKNLPFILVTPVNLTNGGGSNLRNLPEYNYAPSVWDDVNKVGWCDFDLQGLDAVIADVQRLYNGREKCFIAGHSAGAHLTWMMILMRPEKLLGAATTGGNFKNRCITSVSNAPERVDLPVKGFLGETDEARVALAEQFNDANKLANANGYKHISFEVIKGRDHNPLPDEVLAYFNSLLGQPGNVKKVIKTASSRRHR